MTPSGSRALAGASGRLVKVGRMMPSGSVNRPPAAAGRPLNVGFTRPSEPDVADAGDLLGGAAAVAGAGPLSPR